MPSNVSHTSTDLAARIQQIGMAAQRSQKDAVYRASMTLKRSIESELTRAVGGDHEMSNLMKRNGTPPKQMTLGFNVKGTLNPTALLVARGPWGLIEHGAKPHPIFPRLGAITGRGATRARRQRQLAQAFGGRGVYSGVRPMPINGDFRYSVRRHPGFKGKLPFNRGLERAKPQAIKELHATVHSAVVDVVRSGRQTYTYVRGEVGAYT
jgi:hypothetical protein